MLMSIVIMESDCMCTMASQTRVSGKMRLVKPTGLRTAKHNSLICYVFPSRNHGDKIRLLLLTRPFIKRDI